MIKNNPLIRLALPFIVGIVIGWYFSVPVNHAIFMATLSALAMLLGFFRFSPRLLFGAGAICFMLSAGIFVEEKEEAAKSPQWSDAKLRYSATLIEEPDTRSSTVRALADVSLVGECLSDTVRSNGRVYLYFPRCVEAEQLHMGSNVEFSAVISPFRNAGNPAEFDTERFYYIKDITGSAFIGRDGWSDNGVGELSLRMKALELRADVVDMYRRLQFGDSELALLSALTVGEKDDFPKELREEYSAAGASHVLALSGLHLGIFYALLVTLLPLWGRNRLVVVAREGVIVLLLWTFAFVAGLSPSVVRAAILFTLMSLGRCLAQESSSLSSLSFASIAMLVFSPHLLFDISFQLSFAAVLSILLLAPPLQRLLKVDERGRISRYLLNLLVLSYAAQIGTLPFVWYYFGMFPVYFLLTNLVVVPMAFLVVSLSVLVLALAFLPVIQIPFAWLLESAVSMMNGWVSFIAELPGASLGMSSVGVAGACFVAVAVSALLYGLLNRRWWLVALSSCGMLLLPFFAQTTTGDAAGEEGYIMVYNNRRNPLLHVVASDGENCLVSTVPRLDAEYEYSSGPYIKREGLAEPGWAYWNHEGDAFSLKEGLLQFNGLKVRMLDSDLWRENLYTEPTDIVILCRGFKGSIAELAEVYPAGCVILDASLYRKSRERILRECAALGIEPVDISVQGAMKIVAAGDSFKLVPMRGK